MPWQETCAMDQRMRLIEELSRRALPVAQVCALYGVSRETGYKWWRRYQALGRTGLEERSRRPHQFGHAIDAAVAAALVAARRTHRHWGPRKLRAYLARAQPHVAWPAASTIGALLQRHGLVRARPRRRVRLPRGPQRLREPSAPNVVWAADFKGHFRLGDGSRCHPLTVSDLHSRFVLRCQALPRESGALVWPVFEALFRTYGLPQCLRTDNGSPFASRAPGGLTALTVRWVKLGIWPERIAPGRPDQNGCHERMHRTLKAETAAPPRPTARAQQRAFMRFQREFNTVRPHEALGQLPPASRYAPSPRPYPRRLPEPAYPAHFEVRRVRHSGEIKWQGERLYLSEVLRGEPVGLEEIADGVWRSSSPLSLSLYSTPRPTSCAYCR